MEELKHTPGPWKAKLNSCYFQIITDDNPIYDLSSGIFSKGELETNEVAKQYLPERSEVAANMMLMAAAPELLDALQDFVNSCYTGCSKEELNLLRIKAEEVIKKATGKEHRHV